ncbi:MAG: cupin domain-containing protein [Vicingaceae bacterium]
MHTKEFWVKKLNLQAHPEGGFYKETYRSLIQGEFDGFSNKRNLSTGIYFLLDSDSFSAFHRIKSDEMWHHYEGSALTVHMIHEDGEYRKQKIGKNVDQGEVPQFVVPANVWFASEIEEEKGYALVGCTVAPGFDFADFELADKKLKTIFPQHRKLIVRLSH